MALVLSRQNLPTLDRTRYAPADGVRRGAYILADPPGGKIDMILIASGSEVDLITAAQQTLAEQGIAARIVSMPSWELFDAQPEDYRDEILPPSIRARLAVEAGVSQGWWKYVGDRGGIVGIDQFGASAPSKVVFEKFGYTVDNIVAQAVNLVSKFR